MNFYLKKNSFILASAMLSLLVGCGGCAENTPKEEQIKQKLAPVTHSIPEIEETIEKITNPTVLRTKEFIAVKWVTEEALFDINFRLACDMAIQYLSMNNIEVSDFNGYGVWDEYGETVVAVFFRPSPEPKPEIDKES